MKEITFRAWDKISKEISNVKILDIFKRRVGLGWNSYDGITWRNIEDVIIMHYIGLKDKNGREIYEGDIVLIDGGDSLVGIKQQYVVRYDNMNTSYCFETNNGDKIYLTSFGNPDFFIKNKVEVIGNIYENPELIILLSDDA